MLDSTSDMPSVPVTISLTSIEPFTLFLYTFAPISLSVLSHFLAGLYLSCVSMMSYWTARRVRLAASALSSPDDLVLFEKDVKPVLTSRRSSYVTPQGVILDLTSAPSSPVLRRSLSISSATSGRGNVDIDDGASDSGSESGAPLTFSTRRKSSTSSFIKTMRIPDDRYRRGSLENYAMSNRIQNSSEYWLDSDRDQNRPSTPPAYENEKEPFSSMYPLETPDINSPTDMEFPLFGSNEQPLLTGAEIVARQRVTARRILCTLEVLRVLVDVPVVYMEAGRYVTTYRWPSFFVSAFDLVVLDLLLAFLLAVAPLICFAHHASLALPKSFEHHAYYSSSILLTLPLFATLQLPSTQAIQLYRMTAPIISAIMLLIARDQATMDYWKPMEMKDRSRWAA